ncbi:MAG: hypothetical protein Fur0019_09300 [Tibeticola sp.]
MTALQSLCILMVTRETADDRRYGIGKSLWPVVHALRARGHEVRYLSQADLGVRSLRWQRWWHDRLMSHWPPESAQACVLRWAWALVERLNMGRLAARVCARDGFSIVHCHDPLIALGFRLFRPLHAGAWRARWGVTEHGFGSYAQAMQDDGVPMRRGAMRWLRAREAGVLGAAHWVMSPTALALKALARDLSITDDSPRWHAVPHPRPVLRMHGRDSARAQLGWSEDTFYVLGIGRVIPLKQFDVLARACAMMEGQACVQLVLLGEGDRDGLQAKARAAGLERPIQFTLTDDVGLYLAAADVYVSTSATESFGMANLEAVCAGLPCICSPAGGVPEVVGAAAWLVPPVAPVVAGALSMLRSDPTLRTFWAQAAREQASRWPTAEEVAQHYEAIYRQALAG